MYTGPPPTTETSDGRYIHSYPKVKYPSDIPQTQLTDGDGVVIQEKLDGGNFRVLLDHNDRVYGSKKNLRGSNPEEMNLFFRRPAKYIEDTIKETAQTTIVDEFGPLTLFGENFLRHTLDYDWDAAPPFLAFDIYSHNKQEFLPLDTAKEITEQLNLPFVPILETMSTDTLKTLFNKQHLNHIGRGKVTASHLAHTLDYTPKTTPTLQHTLTDFPEEFPYNYPDSAYRDGPPEGIVIKNYTTQTFAKIVRPSFKELNELRWGFTQRDSQTGEGLRKVDYTKYLAAKYITDARIEKQLYKIVLDKGELSKRLIPDLIDGVYHDMWDEHGTEIVTSGETIDTGRLQDITADRCRHRIQSIIDNHNMIDNTEREGISAKEYLESMNIGN